MAPEDTPAGRGGPSSGGFVHRQGGQIVDGYDEAVLLRGMGLGNWLLAEGYMWGFEPPGPLSPREIEALVSQLVGPERAARFWAEFRHRFVGEDDIARIALEGLNHVRLPINSHLVMDDDGAFQPDGVALIDRLIQWCRTHGLWVVLDLHGAPGGQTGTNIDDSPHGTPELFSSPRYLELTVKLWRQLALRYADEPVIAGYDLLNEPLPDEFDNLYRADLVKLYRELTVAIREVDPNHMIIYEGTHSATNWDIFTEVWDANSMLSCRSTWVREGRTTWTGSRPRSSCMRTATSRGASGLGRRPRLSTHPARSMHPPDGTRSWPMRLPKWASPTKVKRGGYFRS
jgi:endoglucanase